MSKRKQTAKKAISQRPMNVWIGHCVIDQNGVPLEYVVEFHKEDADAKASRVLNRRVVRVVVRQESVDNAMFESTAKPKKRKNRK